MVFENEGMIKLLVLKTQPGGDEYHKSQRTTYFYSNPTASQHTGQCLIMGTRSWSRFIAKPSFALRIPKPLNRILIDIMIHSLAQLGWTKNSESWYEDVRCCM